MTTRAALSENPINSEKTKSKSKDSNQSNCCVCDKLIAGQRKVRMLFTVRVHANPGCIGLVLVFL